MKKGRSSSKTETKEEDTSSGSSRNNSLRKKRRSHSKIHEKNGQSSDHHNSQTPNPNPEPATTSKVHKKRRATVDEALLKKQTEEIYQKNKVHSNTQSKSRRKSLIHEQTSFSTNCIMNKSSKSPQITRKHSTTFISSSSSKGASTTTSLKRRRSSTKFSQKKLKHHVQAHDFLSDKPCANNDGKEEDQSLKLPIPGFLEFQIPIININSSQDFDMWNNERFSFASIISRLKSSI